MAAQIDRVIRHIAELFIGKIKLAASDLVNDGGLAVEREDATQTIHSTIVFNWQEQLCGARKKEKRKEVDQM